MSLEHMALAFESYAEESPDGLYPPLAPYDDLWVFDVRAMYPDFMAMEFLVAEDDADSDALLKELWAMEASGEFDWERVHRIAAKRFMYLPWVATDERELSQMVAARQGISSEELNADLVNDETGIVFSRAGSDVLLGANEDVMRPDPGTQVGQRTPLLMETSATGDDRDSGDSFVINLNLRVRPFGDDGYLLTPDDVMAALYPNGLKAVELDAGWKAELRGTIVAKELYTEAERNEEGLVE